MNRFGIAFRGWSSPTTCILADSGYWTPRREQTVEWCKIQLGRFQEAFEVPDLPVLPVITVNYK